MAEAGIYNTTDTAENYEKSKENVKLSANAEEFIPKSQCNKRLLEGNATFDEFIVTTPEDDINNAFNHLRSDPEDLDNVIYLLIHNLSNYFNEESKIVFIVDLIFNKCLEFENFQYLAAKFCKQFSELLPDNVESGISAGKIFRTNLTHRCQSFVKEIKASTKKLENSENFAFFLSELSLILTTQDCSPCNFLLDAVIEVLTTFLRYIDDKTVRGIIQIIKMIGLVLNENRSERFEKFMREIANVIIEGKIEKKHKDILYTSIEIQSNQKKLIDFKKQQENVVESQNLNLTEPIYQNDQILQDDTCFNGTVYFTNPENNLFIVDQDSYQTGEYGDGINFYNPENNVEIDQQYGYSGYNESIVSDGTNQYIIRHNQNVIGDHANLRDMTGKELEGFIEDLDAFVLETQNPSAGSEIEQAYERFLEEIATKKV